MTPAVFITAISLSRTNCCKGLEVVDTAVLEAVLLLALEDVQVTIVFESVDGLVSPIIIVLVFGFVVKFLSNSDTSLFIVSEFSTEDFVGDIHVLKVVIPPSPITIVFRIVVVVAPVVRLFLF